MFSLHIDTARTWRGGQYQALLTVRGLRRRGQRAALAAQPQGELFRRVSGETDLYPLAPRGDLDPVAAWELSRLVRRLAPDVIHAHDAHAVAVAALARSLGRTGSASLPDRLAPGRLPRPGQCVLPLEVPTGGPLHLRIGRDPRHAVRGRRAAGAGLRGARRDRDRTHRASARPRSPPRVRPPAGLPDRRQRPPPSCRTRDSATSSTPRRTSSAKSPTRGC